ncbi:MAG TPA: hypothetical protein VHK24_05025 [Steroidobacter sp.]|nr:hypothetical protein [Steroidobacter sp.]
MDELVRVTVVRSPENPQSGGVPLDYVAQQSFDVGRTLVGSITNALPAIEAGSGMRPSAGAPALSAAVVKDAARKIAETFDGVFPDSTALATDPVNTVLLQLLAAARAVLAASVSPTNPAAALASDSSVQSLKAVGVSTLYQRYIKLVDTFLVQFIRPRPTGPSLSAVADLVRAMRIGLSLVGGIVGFAPFQTLAELRTALEAPLVLPKALQLSQSRVQPVGIADLLVVKQQLLRYEAADIARIENVLMGEQREHTQKHSLTSESETVTETEQVTETQKTIDTDDRTELKSEVQSSLTEALEATGNVKVGYGADNAAGWHFSANAGVKYNRSATESAKFSAEVLKQVTIKAAGKVTQRVKETRRSKTTQVLEDLESFKLANDKGTTHISGVYQYLNKVYLAQVFNFGKRLLFDLMVPEPGAYLLDQARQAAANGALPSPPAPLRWVEYPATSGIDNRLTDGPEDEKAILAALPTAKIHALQPEHLRADEMDGYSQRVGVPYTSVVSRYAVAGITQSPDLRVSTGRTFSRELQKDAAAIVIEDQVALPDGYRAISANVSSGWRHAPNQTESALVTVRIADAAPFLSGDVATALSSADMATHITSEGDVQSDNFSAPVKYIGLLTAPTEIKTGSLSIAVSAVNVDHVTVGIEVYCQRQDGWLRKWQLETYARIAQRHAELESAYRDALARTELALARLGPLGRNPATNRVIERTELKRASIGLISGMDGQSLLGRDAMRAFSDAKDSGGAPIRVAPSVAQPDLATSPDVGAWVRFFEQAFEWEKIAYTFYPYFWARMDRWTERLQLQNDDPQFEAFLKAGHARVVVPVRLGFERAVQYFLVWNEPWMGGDLPDIGDELYLPISEEIREQTSRMGREIPVESPWEITVPTQLLKLRKDNQLPAWTWVGHAGELQALQQGNWVWKETGA